MATAKVTSEAESLLHEYEALKRLIKTHKQIRSVHPPAPQAFAKMQLVTPFNYESSYYYAPSSLPSSGNRSTRTFGVSSSCHNYGSNKLDATNSIWNPPKYSSSVSKPANLVKAQGSGLSSRYKFQQTSALPVNSTIPIISKFKLIKTSTSDANSQQLPSRVASVTQAIETSTQRVNTSYKWSSSAEPRSSVPLKSPEKEVARADNRVFVEAKSKCRLWKFKPECSIKRIAPKGPYFSTPVVKSKYKLVKQHKPRPNKTPPKSIRRVNAYSIKYVPLKTTKRTNRHLSVHKLFPRSLKGTSNNYHWQKQNNLIAKQNLKLGPGLTIIGGLIYKTSKTKLSRKGSLKTNNSKKSIEVINHSSSNKSSDLLKNKIITVRGMKYSMDSNRKILHCVHTLNKKKITNECLKKDTSEHFSPNGPLRIDIGGETYVQTKPGILTRSSTTHLRSLANRAINRSIYRLKASKEKSKHYCMFYNKFGKCNNKEKGICPYIHDAEKVAICKRYLRGECAVQNCPFSHTMCRSKMPVCTFFLHGRCNNDSCIYSHVNVNPRAAICPSFVKGYCPLGEKCKKWHVTVCQQFDQSGRCDKGNRCPLLHRKQRIEANFKMKTTEMSDQLTKRIEHIDEVQSESEDKSPRKRLRLPSFISIVENCESTVPLDVKNSASDTLLLQIMPDFVKGHHQDSIQRVSAHI